jgi:hypothetical protein
MGMALRIEKGNGKTGVWRFITLSRMSSPICCQKKPHDLTLIVLILALKVLPTTTHVGSLSPDKACVISTPRFCLEGKEAILMLAEAWL